jgi:hypothetical protein
MVALKTVHHTTNLMVMVKDINHAIKEVRDCIEHYDIPSSKWIGGQVYDENNVHIGNVSYNGRYFPVSQKATLASVLPINCFIL